MIEASGERSVEPAQSDSHWPAGETAVADISAVLPLVPRNVEYLEGLRGIAASVVFLHHYVALLAPFGDRPWAVRLLDTTPLAILVQGHLAVLVFFVHSGFVLSWKYLNTNDPRIIISMAVRRVVRLGIPIAVAVLVSWALMRFGVSYQLEFETRRGTGAEFLSLFSSYPPPLKDALKDAFGGSLFYGAFRFNGPLWTMTIELICSYAVFLILPLVTRVTMPNLILFSVALSVGTIRDYPWIICFVIGVLFVRLYQHLKDGGNWVGVTRHRNPIALGLAAVALFFGAYPEWSGRHLPVPAMLNPIELVQIISGALIVLLALTTPSVQRFLSTKAMRHLGRLSFPLYLLHLPVLFTVGIASFKALKSSGLPNVWCWIVTFPIAAGTLWIVSWIMSVCVDQPSIRLGKTWLRRRLYAAAE